MSKYSGKCDFWDEIEIFGLEKILKSKIYLGQNNCKYGIELGLTNLRSCMPYAAHIVSMSAHDKNSGTIVLSEKSWVDIEEHDIVRMYADEIAKIYRWCKKHKTNFTLDVVKSRCGYNIESALLLQLFASAKLYNGKPTDEIIREFHLERYNRLRQMLGDDIKNFDERVGECQQNMDTV